MRVPFVMGLLLSCSGPDGQRKDPEICDDGIDNNGDLLIDCDDHASCGGIVCQGQGDDDDTDSTAPPADLEIVLDETQCCDFDYNPPGDCPTKSIGTFNLINRTENSDATFDASCNLVGNQLAIEFQVVGSTEQPSPNLVNSDLYAGATVVVEAFFVCRPQFMQDFETVCQVVAEGEELDKVEEEINVDAHYAAR